MIDRTRFMVSLDSEGFTEPLPWATPGDPCYGCTPDPVVDVYRTLADELRERMARHSAAQAAQVSPHSVMELANAHNDGLVLQRNPEGWNETGMQPIADYGWADLRGPEPEMPKWDYEWTQPEPDMQPITWAENDSRVYFTDEPILMDPIRGGKLT